MPTASFPNLQSNNLQMGSSWNILPTNNSLNFTYGGQVVSSISSSPAVSFNNSIQFLLNGNLVTVANPDPEMTLLHYIRTFTPYKGTKKGCNQGGCGVCMVMMSYVKNGVKKNVTINSCLLKLPDVNQMAITTNDGLGSANNLHTIQKYFVTIGAFQCGYCTSGQIMSIYTAFQTQSSQSNNGETPSFSTVEKCLDGNLCRCTGYRPIIEAFKTLMVNTGAAAAPYVNTSDPVQVADYNNLQSRWINPTGPNVANTLLPVYNPANDTKNCANYLNLPVVTRNPTLLQIPTSNVASSSPMGYNYYSIASWTDLSNTIKAIGDNTKVQIVQGQTSRAVPGYSLPDSVTNVINIENISGLSTISATSNTITVNAGVRIAELSDYLLTNYSSNSNLVSLGNGFKSYASTSVRNLGTVIGGIMMSKIKSYTAGTTGAHYFPSDAAAMLQSIGASVNLYVYDTLGNASSYSGVALNTFLNTTYPGLVVVTAITIPIESNITFKYYRNAERIYNTHANVQLSVKYSYPAGQPTGTISNVTAYVGAIGDSTNNAYQRFTALENYMNGSLVNALTASAVVALATGTNLTFIPYMVSPSEGLTVQTETTYLVQELRGLLIQYLADIQSSATQVRTTKATAIGYQEFWNTTDGLTGAFVSMQQTKQIISSLSGAFTGSAVGIWKGKEVTKATGETQYTADYTESDMLYFQPILCENMPASLQADPYNLGLGYTEINMSGAAFLSAVQTAKNTEGVRFVLTVADYNYEYDSYESLTGPGGVGISSIFKRTSSSQINGWNPFQAYLTGLGTSNTGSNQSKFSLGFGQTFVEYAVSKFFNYKLRAPQVSVGMIVADNPYVAKKLAKLIGSSITFIEPTNPVPINTSLLTYLTGPNQDYVTPQRLTNMGRQTIFAVGSAGIQYVGTTLSTDPRLVAATGTFFNCILTGASGLAVAPLTPYCNDFSTVWNSGTGTRLEGGFEASTSIDAFPLERGSYLMKYNSDGRQNIYATTQVNLWNAYLLGFLDYNYEPITIPGTTTPIYNKNFDLIVPSMGGGFGHKFLSGSTGRMFFGFLLACSYMYNNNIRSPIMYQPDYTESLITDSCGTKAWINYQLAFSDSTKSDPGRIKALSLQYNLDNGYLSSSSSARFGGMAGIVDALYSLNAFRTYVEVDNTFKSGVTPIRAYGQENSQIAHHIIQKIANYNNASFFDTMITNCQSEESPFIYSTPAGTGAAEGFLVSSLNGFISGQWNRVENTWAQQFRAIDRKVNQIYGFNTTPVYTGAPGPAYNDTNARYPAIKALEAQVATFNTGSTYIKQGLAVVPCLYKAAPFAINASVTLTPRYIDDFKIQVDTSGCDTGSSLKQKLINALSEFLYIPQDRFFVSKGISSGKASGFSSVGSVGYLGVHTAAINAANDLMNKMLDLLYQSQPGGVAGATGAGIAYTSSAGSKTIIETPELLAQIKGTVDNAYDDTRQLYLMRFAQQTGTYDWSGLTRSQRADVFAANWEKLIVAVANGAPTTFGVPTKQASWFFGNTQAGGLVGVGNYWLSQFSPVPAGNKLPGVANGTQSYTTLGTNVNTYITWSAALSLAELNVLTGEIKEKHAILSADIGNVQDSISSMGQAEGGYQYGKAYFIHEKKLYNNSNGFVVNNGTWDYKPMCSANSTERTDVIFLNNVNTWLGPGPSEYNPNANPPNPGIKNRNGIAFATKPIGEIMTCASSVYWVAVREAIRAYRNANGLGGNNWLDNATSTLQTNYIKNLVPTLPL